MDVLLLTGPVGSGKTTVLLALGRLLERDGVPHALVDLDWLCWVQPAPETLSVDEVLRANLAAVLPGFARAGVEVLALARSVESAEQLEALRAVVPRLVCARLEVPRAELERRLRARDTGAELEEHLAFLERATPPADVAVPGIGDPAEVAQAIYEAIRPTGQETPVPPSPQ